ncbi:MAG: Smr/MutS family protein [Flavobacteriales bacterium]|nr:Smr/MutS family protein [Flavobacteriales bacterium]
MSAKPLQPGDRVSFVDEVGGGVVLRLVGHRVVRVRTDEGFELDRAEHGLVLVNSELRTRLSQVSDHQAKLIAANDTLEEKRKKQKGARPGKTPKKAEDNSVAEVDLHLHELVDDERNLSDGEKLEFQLRYFERALEGAIRDGKRKLIVIHGVGEGVLREEVRRMLQYYDTVQFHDADMRRFGAGATEVIIHRTR